MPVLRVDAGLLAVSQRLRSQEARQVTTRHRVDRGHTLRIGHRRRQESRKSHIILLTSQEEEERRGHLPSWVSERARPVWKA